MDDPNNLDPFPGNLRKHEVSAPDDTDARLKILRDMMNDDQKDGMYDEESNRRPLVSIDKATSRGYKAGGGVRFFSGDVVMDTTLKACVNHYRVHRRLVGKHITLPVALSYKVIVWTNNRLIYNGYRSGYTFYLDPANCVLISRPWYNRIRSLFFRKAP